MDDARLRAWQALELGPVWLGRGAPAGAQESGASSPAGVDEVSGATNEIETPASACPSAGLVQELESGPSALQPPPVAIPSLQPQRQVVGRDHLLSGLDWDGLHAAVAGCRECRLCEARARTVFGTGPQDARWLVVGEAPGAEEDVSGEPFVGQAGRLLDAMLASIGLDRRHNVFIANVVKCRPPNNRTPSPDEAASCLPFLHRQIELLAPDLVLLLGRVAAHTLLQTDSAVGSLRGRVHALRVGAREVPAVVTWHPSYLLRRPEEKALAWADLCLAMEVFAQAG